MRSHRGTDGANPAWGGVDVLAMDHDGAPGPTRGGIDGTFGKATTG
jgi:hypothetical protein